MQLVGGTFELAGLLTVAKGITQTRTRFTDKPSIGRRVHSFFKLRLDRILKRPAVIHPVSASGSMESFGSVTVKKTRNWSGEPSTLIKQVQQAIDEHEERLVDLDRGLHDEKRQREDDKQRSQQELSELRTHLTDMIREAAAGGLRVETVGVTVFAIGLVLQIGGSIVR